MLKKIYWGSALGLPWIMIGAAYWILTAEERAFRAAEESAREKAEWISEFREQISSQLAPQFLNNQYPTESKLLVDEEETKVQIHYTLDQDLQSEAMKLLKSYRPDYGAIAVMDAVTGKILALASYQRNGEAHQNLALRGTFPAASVFKIVTAGAAVDKYHLSPDTSVLMNGSNHTLYKRNVMNTKVNRWTREITLREAFGRSINTFFGRLTFEKLQPEDIEEYAVRFGFNKRITSDLPFDTGFTSIPAEKNYHLAEIASGFNRVTTMSPIQGAMIAASVAADGIMRVPYIIQSMVTEDEEHIFEAEPVTAAVSMSPEGARQLKVLMEETIFKGTSRSAFKPLIRDKRYRDLELGGKTGSLYGNNPRGKTDWFVGYAIGGETDKLAVAALTVHIDKWTVKSAHLAQSLFKRHFKEQYSMRGEKIFNSASRQ